MNLNPNNKIKNNKQPVTFWRKLLYNQRKRGRTKIGI